MHKRKPYKITVHMVITIVVFITLLTGCSTNVGENEMYQSASDVSEISEISSVQQSTKERSDLQANQNLSINADIVRGVGFYSYRDITNALGEPIRKVTDLGESVEKTDECFFEFAYDSVMYRSFEGFSKRDDDTQSKGTYICRVTTAERFFNGLDEPITRSDLYNVDGINGPRGIEYIEQKPCGNGVCCSFWYLGGIKVEIFCNTDSSGEAKISMSDIVKFRMYR